MDKTIINKQDEAYAQSILKKFYDSGLIPAEKKPYLTKLSMGEGPYLAIESKEGRPHYMLDAASQIATLGHGFNPSTFFGTVHYKASWTNNPYDPEFLQLLQAYKRFFAHKLKRKNITFSFTNSGAEANELAIGMAFEKRLNKNAKKILAFKGSFHGRMLLSLYSTWNPSKREPFQWEGHETKFLEYPELNDDRINREYPTNWKKFWSKDCLDTQAAKPGNWDISDDSLSDEVDCLWAIRNEFSKGEIFTILLEPMQCEGGDRYSSDRFNCALLLLAKQYGVSVVYDEVQTGFHLGREFFWHKQFNLTDEENLPLEPDFIVCAKKAQVGIVLFEDSDLIPRLSYEDQQFQVSSVIRGYIHALGLDQLQTYIHKLEDQARTKLNKLIKNYSEFIERPRVLGLSFAFDIKDQDKVNEFIAHRFEHGLLYYPAGSKTLRFRLNTAFKEKDLDFLFTQLKEIIERTFKGKTPELPLVPYSEDQKSYRYDRWDKWHQRLVSAKIGLKDKESDEFIEHELGFIGKSFRKDVELVAINKENFKNFREDIIRLEQEVYEPTRQTDIKYFETTVQSDRSVAYGLKIDHKIEAIVFAGPIELYPFERGLRRDPDFGKNNSLYMLDTTVHHRYQNYGLGKFLKYVLTLKASEKDITYLKGRNRDRLAAGMLLINLSLGAYEQFYIQEDYPDHAPHRDVIYYKQPLKWIGLEQKLFYNRINGPLSLSFHDHEFIHDQIPQMVNKICLSNFIGEQFLEELQFISNEMPEALRQTYTTSGQSECVDKLAKSILYKDPKKFTKDSYFITFEGHQFGNGSNLSRSLSNTQFFGTKNKNHTDDQHYFKTTTFPQPSAENQHELLKQLEGLIKSDSKVRGIWIEPVRQRDFQKVPLTFLEELCKLSKKYSVPLIYNETGSQQYLGSNDAYFVSNIKNLSPDMAMLFTGGQMGICFLSKEYFLSAPLMMISTWDGDQFALSQYKKAMVLIQTNKETILKMRKDQKSIHRDIQNETGKGLLLPPISLETIGKCLATRNGHQFDPVDLDFLTKTI